MEERVVKVEGAAPRELRELAASVRRTIEVMLAIGDASEELVWARERIDEVAARLARRDRTGPTPRPVRVGGGEGVLQEVLREGEVTDPRDQPPEEPRTEVIEESLELAQRCCLSPFASAAHRLTLSARACRRVIHATRQDVTRDPARPTECRRRARCGPLARVAANDLHSEGVNAVPFSVGAG